MYLLSYYMSSNHLHPIQRSRIGIKIWIYQKYLLVWYFWLSCTRVLKQSIRYKKANDSNFYHSYWFTRFVFSISILNQSYLIHFRYAEIFYRIILTCLSLSFRTGYQSRYYSLLSLYESTWDSIKYNAQLICYIYFSFDFRWLAFLWKDKDIYPARRKIW